MAAEQGALTGFQVEVARLFFSLPESHGYIPCWASRGQRRFIDTLRVLKQKVSRPHVLKLGQCILARTSTEEHRKRRSSIDAQPGFTAPADHIELPRSNKNYSVAWTGRRLGKGALCHAAGFVYFTFTDEAAGPIQFDHDCSDDRITVRKCQNHVLNLLGRFGLTESR